MDDDDGGDRSEGDDAATGTPDEAATAIPDGDVPGPAPDAGDAAAADEVVLIAVERVEALVARGREDTMALLTALERLDGRIAERDRLAERDRDLVDRLHAENQRLRAGEAFQMIAPVARDLVRLRDQARQLDAASPEPGKGDAALIEPQLVQILARMGVEAYEPEPGEAFDAARHQGVGRRPTPDAALDGTVAAVRREGFAGPDTRPLRPAEVEVWRHDPAPAPTGPADTYAAGDDSPPLGGD
jgi:molecular chaperone GrpE (heat shock protein)